MIVFGPGFGLDDGRLVLLVGGLQRARAARRRQCHKHPRGLGVMAFTSPQERP